MYILAQFLVVSHKNKDVKRFNSKGCCLRLGGVEGATAFFSHGNHEEQGHTAGAEKHFKAAGCFVRKELVSSRCVFSRQSLAPWAELRAERHPSRAPGGPRGRQLPVREPRARRRCSAASGL